MSDARLSKSSDHTSVTDAKQPPKSPERGLSIDPRVNFVDRSVVSSDKRIESDANTVNSSDTRFDSDAKSVVSVAKPTLLFIGNREFLKKCVEKPCE